MAEKEFLNADVKDAGFVGPGNDVVFYDNDFLEGVVDAGEGVDLLFALLLGVNI